VDVPLAQEGREQAGLAGKRLAKLSIDMLYASDLLRARETAEIIREQFLAFGKDLPPVSVRSGLQEIDFGELTGRTDADIKKRYDSFWQERRRLIGRKDIGFPGGECGEDVWKRLSLVLQEMIESGKETVAAVSHGGTIRVLLAALFGGGQQDRLRFALNMENTAITELFYDENDRRFYLERFNDYAHLEEHETLLRKSWK